MTDFFNILDDRNIDPETRVLPFFKVKDESKENLLDWLNIVKDALIQQSEDRTSIQRENLALYRGVSIKKWERSSDREANHRRFNKIQKFVVNHLFDLTETKVSQLTRLKPAVEILPTNDEWNDRASAKVVELIVKHLWYINNIDSIISNMQRQARIFGESFCFVLWDESKGDLTKAYVEARDHNLKISKQKMDIIKKTGDISYEPELPWRVLLQRKASFNDSEYVFRVSIEDTEKLKLKYPKNADKIKEDEDLKIFDAEDLKEKFLENSTLVFKFFHKKTEEVEEGSYIKFTKDVILEEGDLPFNHGQLPLVRLTDLDVPDVLNGVSKFEMVAPIQRMYNNISTLITKNIYLTAHAKWVMPRGTCKIEQLGNDNTIVQYQGAIPPQLLQVAPNSAEVYAFRDKLVQDMQIIYGSHGISRGEIPKGITAASALQFLNELETERSTSDIAKHGDLIKNIAKMTIAVAGDNYSVDDDRMIRVVGENNKYLIRHFDISHLHKAYDIRVDNSSGLPETKAAKYQRILDTMQRHPTMLSPERWTELLDLANIEKMNTLITEAIKSADSENEDILAGRPVRDAEEWEDHILHWEAHVKVMQSRQFKEEATEEVREAMKDHLFWTEEAMLEKMPTNPEFEAKLATLLLFPIFTHSNYSIPRSLEQQMAMVQGQANRGDEVTGMIPGTNPNDIAEMQNARDNLRRK